VSGSRGRVLERRLGVCGAAAGSRARGARSRGGAVSAAAVLLGGLQFGRRGGHRWGSSQGRDASRAHGGDSGPGGPRRSRRQVPGARARPLWLALRSRRAVRLGGGRSFGGLRRGGPSGGRGGARRGWWRATRVGHDGVSVRALTAIAGRAGASGSCRSPASVATGSCRRASRARLQGDAAPAGLALAGQPAQRSRSVQRALARGPSRGQPSSPSSWSGELPGRVGQPRRRGMGGQPNDRRAARSRPPGGAHRLVATGTNCRAGRVTVVGHGHPAGVTGLSSVGAASSTVCFGLLCRGPSSVRFGWIAVGHAPT
jgi:hypothetical protein